MKFICPYFPTLHRNHLPTRRSSQFFVTHSFVHPSGIHPHMYASLPSIHPQNHPLVERQRPCPAQRRSSTLPTTKQDRHPTCKRNPLHHEDSLSNTAIQYLLHQSTVQDVIHKRSNNHQDKLQSHPNPLLQSLSRNNIPRRLK